MKALHRLTESYGACARTNGVWTKRNEVTVGKNYSIRTFWSIPLAAWFKACVCGRSIAGTAGSNPAAGVDFSLLSVLCAVRADH